MSFYSRYSLSAELGCAIIFTLFYALCAHVKYTGIKRLGRSGLGIVGIYSFVKMHKQNSTVLMVKYPYFSPGNVKLSPYYRPENT